MNSKNQNQQRIYTPMNSKYRNHHPNRNHHPSEYQHQSELQRIFTNVKELGKTVVARLDEPKRNWTNKPVPKANSTTSFKDYYYDKDGVVTDKNYNYKPLLNGRFILKENQHLNYKPLLDGSFVLKENQHLNQD